MRCEEASRQLQRKTATPCSARHLYGPNSFATEKSPQWGEEKSQSGMHYLARFDADVDADVDVVV